MSDQSMLVHPLILGNEPLDPHEAATKQYVDVIIAAIAGADVVVMEYKIKTPTDASDPGSGCIKFNISTQSDATELYIDQVSAAGRDWTNYIMSLVAGQKLTIQSIIDHNRLARWVVAAPATDNIGWLTLPVTPVDATGFPLPNNSDVALAVVGVPLPRATIRDLALRVTALEEKLS